MKEGGQSSSSMLGAVLVLYWILYFGLQFVAWAKGKSVLWLVVICLVAGALLRVVTKWMKEELGGFVLPEEDSHSSTEPLPFFVKGQVRRRKLDLTRASNFIKDSVGTKHKRQMRGILRKKKK